MSTHPLTDLYRKAGGTLGAIPSEVLTRPNVLTGQDLERIEAINARIPGWSKPAHYAFFKWLLAHEWVNDVLMLGVYHGRDLAYMQDIAERYRSNRPLNYVGVDKFDAGPCDDWTQAARGRTWEQNGFGEPPSLERAAANLGLIPSGKYAMQEGDAKPDRILCKEPDGDFLIRTPDTFDAVYIDTAHDYETVQRQLRQVPRVLRERAIICGDDFSDQGTWGVKRAVGESFNSYSVVAGWIWHSERSNLRQ
jgi:hypothetical protein